jgi:hypothetical protein
MGDRATALKFFNRAVDALNDKSNPNHASHSYQLFTSACLVDPSFGKGWFQNGNNTGDMNWLHSAIGYYRRALCGDVDKEERVKTLSNLSWRLHQIGEIEEALATARECVELDPLFAYGWVNLSVAEGKNRLASLAAARKALELSPDDETCKFQIAFALLHNRNLQEGFKYFEFRFPTRLKQFETYPYPKWLGEEGKTIYLVADQGLGDTFSFSRFIDAAAKRAKYIHAGIQPELMRAFNEAFVHLPNVNFVPLGTGFPPADAWTTFVSLPFALGLTDKEIRDAPHFKLPVYDIDKSWKVPDQKLHIGVAWSGSPMNDIDQWRAINIVRFLDLYKVPGIQLYGLQMDQRKDDIGKVGAYALIRDLSPWIRDVVDTVSILQHLDLVISLESFLPHLCGTIGKEVWIPYSFHSHDYRIGHDDSDILWYKTHRLFHQGRNYDWIPVFDKIADALRERLGKK